MILHNEAPLELHRISVPSSRLFYLLKFVARAVDPKKGNSTGERASSLTLLSDQNTENLADNVRLLQGLSGSFKTKKRTAKQMKKFVAEANLLLEEAVPENRYIAMYKEGQIFFGIKKPEVGNEVESLWKPHNVGEGVGKDVGFLNTGTGSGVGKDVGFLDAGTGSSAGKDTGFLDFLDTSFLDTDTGSGAGKDTAFLDTGTGSVVVDTGTGSGTGKDTGFLDTGTGSGTGKDTAFLDTGTGSGDTGRDSGDTYQSETETPTDPTGGSKASKRYNLRQRIGKPPLAPTSSRTYKKRKVNKSQSSNRSARQSPGRKAGTDRNSGSERAGTDRSSGLERAGSGNDQVYEDQGYYDGGYQSSNQIVKATKVDTEGRNDGLPWTGNEDDGLQLLNEFASGSRHLHDYSVEGRNQVLKWLTTAVARDPMVRSNLPHNTESSQAAARRAAPAAVVVDSNLPHAESSQAGERRSAAAINLALVVATNLPHTESSRAGERHSAAAINQALVVATNLPHGESSRAAATARAVNLMESLGTDSLIAYGALGCLLKNMPSSKHRMNCNTPRSAPGILHAVGPAPGSTRLNTSIMTQYLPSQGQTIKKYEPTR
ncbi:hypothetical protein OROGR_016774 [Orobanche gracilis]